MRKTESEREADKRAKKAIAELELMKIERQQKAQNKRDPDGGISLGTKITFVIAVVLAVVVSMKQHTPEETKMSFTEAKEYWAEQGKLLPLTMHDDPEHLSNLYTLEGKAYWTAEGKLIYNMDLGHQSYPPNTKHYVICVEENGKTHSTPIDATISFK